MRTRGWPGSASAMVGAIPAWSPWHGVRVPHRADRRHQPAPDPRDRLLRRAAPLPLGAALGADPVLLYLAALRLARTGAGRAADARRRADDAPGRRRIHSAAG